jgi:hypothetical protein
MEQIVVATLDGRMGLVNCEVLDRGNRVWEVSHDFVARLLGPILKNPFRTFCGSTSDVCSIHFPSEVWAIAAAMADHPKSVSFVVFRKSCLTNLLRIGAENMAENFHLYFRTAWQLNMAE